MTTEGIGLLVFGPITPHINSMEGINRSLADCGVLCKHHFVESQIRCSDEGRVESDLFFLATVKKSFGNVFIQFVVKNSRRSRTLSGHAIVAGEVPDEGTVAQDTLIEPPPES